MEVVSAIRAEPTRIGSESKRDNEAHPSPEVAALMGGLGLTRTIATWLVALGRANVEATRAFLEPRLATLTNPDTMRDRNVAAERLTLAIRRHERIVVFGDYDCDGMTSTALLTEALRELGGEVVPVLASRFQGGYGLSPMALERVLAQEPGLVVTCDCGSSDHASLRELSRLGVDAIVVDHHLVPAEALPALAFLNPHRPDCGFEYKGLASVGLCLGLVGAVRTRLGQKLDLKRWLDLVAIGTVADVAPLDADNRALVRAGLEVMTRAERPGLRALFELAKIEYATGFTCEDIAYRIAPRLNAPGRLGSPMPALELLLAKTSSEAQAIASGVEQQSAERRRVQDSMLEAATRQIEEAGYANRPAIVLGERGWNHGIVGIVAGRLAERFQKPVIVVGFEDDVGRGSVRGPQGFRLHDALTKAAHTLVRFGGHQAAAGLEVLWPELGALRDAFEAACAVAEPGTGVSASSALVTPYFDSDDPKAVLRDLCRVEPCGLRNPRPELQVEARVQRARVVKGGHLKLDLELADGTQLGGFAPGLGNEPVLPGARIRFVGQLKLDHFRGSGAVEFNIKELSCLPVKP